MSAEDPKVKAFETPNGHGEPPTLDDAFVWKYSLKDKHHPWNAKLLVLVSQEMERRLEAVPHIRNNRSRKAISDRVYEFLQRIRERERKTDELEKATLREDQETIAQIWREHTGQLTTDTRAKRRRSVSKISTLPVHVLTFSICRRMQSVKTGCSSIVLAK